MAVAGLIPTMLLIVLQGGLLAGRFRAYPRKFDS
jgi:hypothetical protein